MAWHLIASNTSHSQSRWLAASVRMIDSIRAAFMTIRFGRQCARWALAGTRTMMPLKLCTRSRACRTSACWLSVALKSLTSRYLAAVSSASYAPTTCPSGCRWASTRQWKNIQRTGAERSMRHLCTHMLSHAHPTPMVHSLVVTVAFLSRWHLRCNTCHVSELLSNKSPSSRRIRKATLSRYFPLTWVSAMSMHQLPRDLSER